MLPPQSDTVLEGAPRGDLPFPLVLLHAVLEMKAPAAIDVIMAETITSLFVLTSRFWFLFPFFALLLSSFVFLPFFPCLKAGSRQVLFFFSFLFFLSCLSHPLSEGSVLGELSMIASADFASLLFHFYPLFLPLFF